MYVYPASKPPDWQKVQPQSDLTNGGMLSTPYRNRLKQVVQYNMVYQPQEVLMGSSSTAARLIDADR